jgi:hypothetical protein
LFKELIENVELEHNPVKDEFSMEKFIEINQLLQKINFYQKKDNTDDFKTWIDRHNSETIF